MTQAAAPVGPPARAGAMFKALTMRRRAIADYRQFVLTYLQPGLAGFMDGTMSTLAPVFAAALATGDSWATCRVGLAAALGAGISMGVTEVAADDGALSGRGSPRRRGMVTGVCTLLGGLGHALPYLIDDFFWATTVAIGVVGMELAAIVAVQRRFMAMPVRTSLCQVTLGGALVVGVGMMIGRV